MRGDIHLTRVQLVVLALDGFEAMRALILASSQAPKAVASAAWWVEDIHCRSLSESSEQAADHAKLVRGSGVLASLQLSRRSRAATFLEIIRFASEADLAVEVTPVRQLQLDPIEICKAMQGTN